MGLYKRAVRKYQSDGLWELLKSSYNFVKKRTMQKTPYTIQKRIYDVKSRDELHEYWRTRSKDGDQPYDAGNDPQRYLTFDPRSEYLVDLFNSFANKEDHILELGCNVGRNLHYLHENGYQNLYGIEINSHTLEILEEEYPDLSRDAELYNSTIEQKITEFDEDEIDICFTMAVLEHIHPDSEWIFQEMVNITSKYIVLIENEEQISWRHVPRRYDEIFTELGCEVVKSVPGDQFPEKVDLPSGFAAHILKCPSD
jgi:SAM-dependent methyltransferase